MWNWGRGRTDTAVLQGYLCGRYRRARWCTDLLLRKKEKGNGRTSQEVLGTKKVQL